MKYTIFFLLGLLGLSCTSGKKTAKSPTTQKEPMVLTVILNLQSASDGQVIEAKLINIVRAPGQMKPRRDEHPNYEFRFVDGRGQRLDARFKRIDLPKVVEYVDEDGNLAKKTLDGEPVVVAVRANVQANMQKLVVLKLDKENFEPIATFLLTDKDKK